MEANAWHRIVAYRDFRDVPHYALAADEAEIVFGCIPVAHVQFDETRRAAMKLTSQPIT